MKRSRYVLLSGGLLCLAGLLLVSAFAAPTQIGGRFTGLFEVADVGLNCSVDVNGTTLDAEDANSCTFQLTTSGTFTGTNTTPNYQGSWDGTNFFTLFTGTAITATGVTQTTFPTGSNTVPLAWPRYVRVRLVETALTACTADVRVQCVR